LERQIEELARLVQNARRGVVFTGAGISTECGIPDFRSPGGFWTKNKPIQFQEFLASEETRIEAWRRFFQIHDLLTGAQPGPSHRAVAELHARGHIAKVITQNIDDLHERSGIPARDVIRLHGTGTHASCLSCGMRHEIADIRAALQTRGHPPPCNSCGGIVKSATVSFGQSMPEQSMADARAATFNSDLFVAAGSSLVVFPAAGFPVMASDGRIPLVIINREATGLDGLSRLVINAELHAVLPAVASKLPILSESPRKSGLPPHMTVQ
jgi:NAD-dependent deacetylase